jgi:hypothetical protein
MVGSTVLCRAAASANPRASAGRTSSVGGDESGVGGDESGVGGDESGEPGAAAAAPLSPLSARRTACQPPTPSKAHVRSRAVRRGYSDEQSCES